MSNVCKVHHGEENLEQSLPGSYENLAHKLRKQGIIDIKIHGIDILCYKQF